MVNDSQTARRKGCETAYLSSKLSKRLKRIIANTARPLLSKNCKATLLAPVARQANKIFIANVKRPSFLQEGRGATPMVFVAREPQEKK